MNPSKPQLFQNVGSFLKKGFNLLTGFRSNALPGLGQPLNVRNAQQQVPQTNIPTTAPNFGAFTPSSNLRPTNTPATSPVALGGVPVATTENPVSSVGGSVSEASFNTGNSELDDFLNGLPQIQKALGIGVETPEQKTQRETQTAGLNRLLTLQEELIKSGAPSKTLSEIDRAIADTSKALDTTRPDELFKSMPGFQNAGITQGALLRESAARADPIARTLSDLISSRSIIAETQQQQRQFISDQMSGIQNVLNINEAIASLQPSSGLPEAVRTDILKALVGRAFQDPTEKALKLAQLSNIQARTAKLTGAGGRGALTSAQKTRMDAINTVSGQLQNYRNLIDKYTGFGGAQLTGKQAAELRTAKSALEFSIANAVGTGALQAADREVVRDLLPDPTSLRGASGIATRGGKGGSLASIDQAQAIFDAASQTITSGQSVGIGDVEDIVLTFLEEEGL